MVIFFIIHVTLEKNFGFQMESGNTDQTLFNSSTEFLISFDSADDTKLGLSEQRCQDPGTGIKVVSDDTGFADGQLVNAADSEQIVCEFSDVDSGWFASSNTEAGESANSEDVWLSLMSCVKPDVQLEHQESAACTALAADEGSSKNFADRKSKYVQLNADISRDFNANDDGAANGTLFETADTRSKGLADGEQNQAVNSNVFLADQQFTSQQDFAKQDTDVFSAFVSVVAENANAAQIQIGEVDGNKFGDGDHNQSELFPDNDGFCQRLNDSEDTSPVFSTVAVFDQQPVDTASDEVSEAKHKMHAVWPEIHSCAVKQELSCEFSGQIFSEGVVPAENSDLLVSHDDVLDACDVSVAVEEIEVCLLKL